VRGLSRGRRRRRSEVRRQGAWAPRIAAGADTLHKHALAGFQGKNGYMPPKGGRTDLSDQSIINAVDYMVSQSKIAIGMPSGAISMTPATAATRTVVVFAAALALAACTTPPQQPESMRDPQANFAAFRTYGWQASRNGRRQGPAAQAARSEHSHGRGGGNAEARLCRIRHRPGPAHRL
jgi:hypothetical protein